MTSPAGDRPFNRRSTKAAGSINILINACLAELSAKFWIPSGLLDHLAHHSASLGRDVVSNLWHSTNLALALSFLLPAILFNQIV
ncbi:hypothetical protein AAII07_52270 [Microvirga sp. 0TCS3.31]